MKKFLIPIILSFIVAFSDTYGKSKKNIDLSFSFKNLNETKIISSVKNNTQMPFSLKVEFELENMRSSAKNPILTVIKPYQFINLTTLSVRDEDREFYYSYSYVYYTGDINAKHNDSYIYTLPIKPEAKVYITQGYNSKFSHYGEYKYSIDFDLKEGTPIYACREGVVINVVENFTKGGPDPKLEDKANVVMILHDDNTIASYVHLKHNGAEVKVGDKLKTGDFIGYSGNVGYSDGPHLHFHVFKPKNFSEMQTFPTIFKTKEKSKTILYEDKTYTRPK